LARGACAWRLCRASGGTKGHVRRPSGQRLPNRPSSSLDEQVKAHKAQIPLRDRHLRIALNFRELSPAVPGETEERPSSMLVFYSFIHAGSRPERQDDESSKQVSFMLRKALHLLVMCTSPSSMSVKPLFGE